MTAGDTDAVVEWVPGETDHDEPELARVGRLAIGHSLVDHTESLYHQADDVLQRAFDGEDVTADDLEAFRRELSGLEFVLEAYVEPVVEERDP